MAPAAAGIADSRLPTIWAGFGIRLARAAGFSRTTKGFGIEDATP